MAAQSPNNDYIPATDPTREIGTSNASVLPWSAFHDSTEELAELSFPASIATYNQMRNDEQIAALHVSFVLPILGYRWYIDPNGARDDVVEDVARDYGLPIEGQDDDIPVKRLSGRFDFYDYLRHCLLKLLLGFMMFEQVYRLGGDGKFHVRKYAPRMPGSIQQIQSAPDGGLMFIRQFPVSDGIGGFINKTKPSPLDLLGGNPNAPTIPVDRLIAHVCDKEGANWFGRPWTRAVYRNWLMKDRLLRVDALKHERNGMGVPTGKTQPGVSQGALDKLLDVVKRWKAGENSAAALPPGTDIELKGVQGTLPDTLASIKYHDEQIARRWIAMFMPLGSTDSGSRALGETFVDFFGLAQESIAGEIALTTNKYGIEDLVDLNYGISEAAPLLKFRPESDRGLPTTDLVGLINAGAITVDPALETWLRAEHDMPAKDKADPVAPPSDPSQPPTPPQQRQRFRVETRLHAMVQPLLAVEQRGPSQVEKNSKVDFSGLKDEFNAALTALVTDWDNDIRPQQIDEIVAMIGALQPDDLDGLANLQATATGADLIHTAMDDLATKAADRAVQEIKDQSVAIDEPDLTDLKSSLGDRASAVETLMARSISTAAADRALSQTGGSLNSIEIAQDVGAHLRSLTTAYLNDEFGGALMHAQNTARRTVFDTVEDKTIYSSELLDSSTCFPCSEIDGHEFATMVDAEHDYPSGGFKDCLGGYRCRGTLVAVAGTEATPSVQ